MISTICLVTLTFSTPINENGRDSITALRALRARAVGNSARITTSNNIFFGNNKRELSYTDVSGRDSLRTRDNDSENDNDNNNDNSDNNNDNDNDSGKRSVLRRQSFNSISIADGTAGNADKEANRVFSAINKNNLGQVSRADYEIIKDVNEICNEAEADGFNPAIESASGEKAEALKRGKTKNKVLKLTATKLALGIERAQGKDVDDKMADATKQLRENIQADRQAAGETSKGVNFDRGN